ncbi:UDP-glucose 4-epimerase GalE [uncultured Desulfuromonas sp.]|uniref:UDP-glucose 4-epimerase GalE n=1 Tax=uncultured Desulfuromonas sp. TaxID=181013 RepID=UPI002AAC0F7C|nr:UDP-glucose 4-epimerase GalE [uncultured Desulfuromonas sp.]
MQVLVTGGAGYIGSHTMVELLSAGHEVVCIDNLVNASQEAVRRVEAITGKNIIFYPYDVGDRQRMKEIFAAHHIDAVIHFAGHKAVGESVTNPLRYYTNNVGMTFTLCEVMADYGCKNLVFSSSATVYGDPVCVPITENAMVAPTNPYGRTKLMIEQVLGDLSASDPNWNIVVLRYFNPIGAHESGMLGEDPRGIPNNLLPFIAQVAVGKRDKLYVFGDDYPTPDGTGVRDYVHVVDLAKGHVSALDKGLEWTHQENKLLTVNLGTGEGSSVLDVVKAFEWASGIQIPFEIVSRRPGDVASCYAEANRAYELLGWKSEFDLQRMCEDAWRWQRANPDGYADFNDS